MSEEQKPTFSLAQILFGVAALFVLGGVIPALLDSSNDLAVIVGVMVIISALYGVVKYHKAIMKRFGINIEE